jgi:hypothetical protein
MTHEAAARIQSAEARAHGGGGKWKKGIDRATQARSLITLATYQSSTTVAKGSFAARAQSAAAQNGNTAGAGGKK